MIVASARCVHDELPGRCLVPDCPHAEDDHTMTSRQAAFVVLFVPALIAAAGLGVELLIRARVAAIANGIVLGGLLVVAVALSRQGS